MKTLYYFLVICLLLILSCQNTPTTVKHDHQLMDTVQLSEAFEQFKEPSLTHRRIKHRDIEPLLQALNENNDFSITRLGQSVQQRAIYQVDYGSGDKKIMLWSQMHGDESTATMALFDIFNFLAAKNDAYDSIRTILKSKTHLMFIPMLNPDGAERFQRRNAMGIDLNQDARRGTTPEASLLIEAAKKNEPDYGYNLHDQQKYYTAAYSGKAATISFLAPAYNYEREINDVRSDAMKIIVGMNKLLQAYIPGHVARYNDTHEPRGFGDNFQKWGASTVLIESGGYPGDPEKQFIRKLNFIIILQSLLDIALDNYQQNDVQGYASIPENAVKLNDVVIRNIHFKNDTLSYKTDVAIRQDEITTPKGFYHIGRIADVGDLKESHGYHELDAEGLTFAEAKVYPEAFSTLSAISLEKATNLLHKGYYAVKIENMPTEKNYNLPLVVLKNGSPLGGGLYLGMRANFFLKKGNALKYAMINGYLIDLEKPIHQNFQQYVR